MDFADFKTKISREGKKAREVSKKSKGKSQNLGIFTTEDTNKKKLRMSSGLLTEDTKKHENVNSKLTRLFGLQIN